MSSNRASTSSRNASDSLFGWDLLYRSIENDIQTKSDVLVALLHILLIRHGNFRCCGLGEEKTLTQEDAASCSELLPDGWNGNSSKYALRYVHDKKLFVLLAYQSEDSLIVNLINTETKRISNIGLEPRIEVVQLKGKLEELIPKSDLLVQRVQKELIDPVILKAKKAAPVQGAPSSQPQFGTDSDPLRIYGPPPNPDRDPLRIFGPRPVFGGDRPTFGIPDPRFPEVGRSDLDPFGRLGPGNLLPQPARPQFGGNGQPRFDPFGLPDDPTRRDPNPDHFPPPGFGGNYFL